MVDFGVFRVKDSRLGSRILSVSGLDLTMVDRSTRERVEASVSHIPPKNGLNMSEWSHRSEPGFGIEVE